MTDYIFRDLNVRDPFVSPSTDLLLEDTKVVVQSIWRLINTEVGEIPFFRAYGLSVKRFSQYPFTKENVEAIKDYVIDKIETFEGRAVVEKTLIGGDVFAGRLELTFYVRVKSTGEVVALPTWTVQVATY